MLDDTIKMADMTNVQYKKKTFKEKVSTAN